MCELLTNQQVKPDDQLIDYMHRHSTQCQNREFAGCSPINRSSQATSELTTCTAMLSQAGRSDAPPSTRPCSHNRKR